jgi:hypothetical protein
VNPFDDDEMARLKAREEHEALDIVLRNCMFSADNAVLKAGAFITDAAKTRAAVEGAFRCALRNGMISINEPDQWEEWMAV